MKFEFSITEYSYTPVFRNKNIFLVLSDIFR